MKFEQTGVILCAENYDDCVAFYATALQLPIRKTLDNEHSKLTVFEFGASTYLMVETGGEATTAGKTIKQNPVWLRFNVTSVDDAAAELADRGVEVRIRREAWGTVGDFNDPDGNICSLREQKPNERPW
ncbi:MAG: VOC family protein [Pseudomonadota bacterium]